MTDNRICGTMQDLLPAYELGRLAEDERAALEAHLAWCATCQHARADWQAITALLQRDAQTVPPAPAQESIWGAISQELPRKGQTVALHDPVQRNGHYPLADLPPTRLAVIAQTQPASRGARTPASAAEAKRPRTFRMVAAAVLIAVLAVALFGALAARRGVPAHSQSLSPTPTLGPLPAALIIPGNLLTATSLHGTDFWIGGDDLLAHAELTHGWQQITISKDAIVESIAMVTPTEGWAVGRQGPGSGVPFMLHDAHGTWQPVSAPVELIGVQMASATDGWAWGNGVVLRYDGTAWNPVLVPFTGPYGAEVDALAAVAPGEAWVASGHTLWHYSNGAWTLGADLGSEYVNSFSFASPTNGWADGYLTNQKQGPYANDVWRWQGTSWQRVQPAPDILNIHRYAIDTFFVTQTQDGWATLVLNGQTANAPATLDGHLLRYHQGTWSLVAIPPGLWVRSIETIGPNEAWAVGSTVGTNETVVILHYLNGTWHYSGQ